HGDTSTSFVAALAAFYHQIPVGHVEAGLRTFDKYSPYPEEMNRQMTGRLADIHFSPTIRNKNNLLAENVAEEDIYITGNTVIDALLDVAARDYKFEGELAEVFAKNHRVISVTCHRRENLGEYMANIFSALADIPREYEDVEIVYPVHLNPKVVEAANKYLGGLTNVHLISPLSYQPFTKLMQASYLVVTDSGGIQEEAPALGKPVLVVRKETERPEAVEAGTVRLTGVEQKDIYNDIKELLDSKESYSKMANAINPYGDGKASERIAEALKNFDKKNK
ncbi:MAG: UDP-N-acetylglucosamine 2-epimerase (non-hydrolyzing), partial [Clostridia bacterium]|nr:UDP-N-acetylglucosamine 2-epimerase (non-hydrolyzing) [Clostridia bacterium]